MPSEAQQNPKKRNKEEYPWEGKNKNPEGIAVCRFANTAGQLWVSVRWGAIEAQRREKSNAKRKKKENLSKKKKAAIGFLKSACSVHNALRLGTELTFKPDTDVDLNHRSSAI